MYNMKTFKCLLTCIMTRTSLYVTIRSRLSCQGSCGDASASTLKVCFANQFYNCKLQFFENRRVRFETNQQPYDIFVFFFNYDVRYELGLLWRDDQTG